MRKTLPPTAWGTSRGAHTLEWGRRTYLMGILNITPDSFSRDGLATEGLRQDEVTRLAVAKAERMVADGADILDVGGESTRPSTVDQPPLAEEVERERVLPVVAALRRTIPAHVLLSIDTYKAGVARAALDAGADIVNDISGLQGDPAMARLVAERGVPLVAMSNLRGQPRRDPVGDVVRQLARCLRTALDAGIVWERIILDPGLGFGLVGAENLDVLRRLGEVCVLGRPLLVGTSRKAHIGLVLGTPVDDRAEGTAATVALSIAQGADIVRVHDVRMMARVARMADAVVRGWEPEQHGEGHGHGHG